MSEAQQTLMTPAATPNAAGAAAEPAGQPAAQQAQAEPPKTDTASAKAEATPPADQKAASDDKAVEKTDEKKVDDKPKAPEKYEFKAPEGREFDPEVLKVYAEVAKEVDLSQEDAQKVLDKIAPALAEKQTRALQAATAEWAEQARADKEFGGAKFDANLAVAQKALDQFGTPELRQLLAVSGLGNHPDVVRLFYRVGKAVSDDTFVGSGNGAVKNASKSPAAVLYPNHPH